jgi:hypothetical protein
MARVEKLDHPVSYSRLSGFGSFQNRNEEGAKLIDLKIQGVLMHEKILKSICSHKNFDGSRGTW